MASKISRLIKCRLPVGREMLVGRADHGTRGFFILCIAKSLPDLYIPPKYPDCQPKAWVASSSTSILTYPARAVRSSVGSPIESSFRSLTVRISACHAQWPNSRPADTLNAGDPGSTPGESDFFGGRGLRGSERKAGFRAAEVETATWS